VSANQSDADTFVSFPIPPHLLARSRPALLAATIHTNCFKMASQNESNILSAPKRSLFKKPSRVEPVEEDEALQLFSRSKEIFPDIIAENERRWKNSENRSSNGTAELTGCSVLDGKRRRISQESEDSGEHSNDEIMERLLQGRR
jgi:hypothetical protein